MRKHHDTLPLTLTRGLRNSPPNTAVNLCQVRETAIDIADLVYPGGVFVINMCSDIDRCLAHLEKVRAVFGGEFMTLQVRPNGNLIVFAFKELLRPAIDWERLEATAVDLKRRFGLDFPKYVRRIALDWKLPGRDGAFM